jgi:hypothetical protein
MRAPAWWVSVAWLVVALAVAARGFVVALRAGRGDAIRARLKSPTVYLFAGYLVIAGLVSPRSPGESSSPLYGLAVALLFGWVAATGAAAAVAERTWTSAALHFTLYGGAVLAAGALILALSSPAFVPPWLR